MSPDQILKQLQHILQTATWSTPPNDLLFGANGSVIITGGVPPDKDSAALGYAPVVLLGVGAAEHDPDDPDIMDQIFKLALAVVVAGDSFGTASLVGANRGVDGVNWQGQNRGLLELQREVLGAVGRLTGYDGVPVKGSVSSSAAPAPIGDGMHVMGREYDLRCVCTRQEEYTAPYDLVATNNADGSISLSWKIPPGDRFDYRDLVLRHAAGSVAPASATAGAGVDLGDAATAKAATAVVHTPGADGNHSYALFAGYTDTGRDENERFSDQETGTTSTVTVTGS